MFQPRARITLALALAVALALAGCDERIIDGVGEAATANITVENAVISRCNQMMSFAELSFTFTIENTSDEPIVIGAVGFDGTSPSGDATYAEGDIGLTAPVTLPVGGIARFQCAPDVPLSWSQGGEDGAMEVSVALSAVGGGDTGVSSGFETLSFIEAWDNCDTFATEPHPCTPIPMN